MKKSLLFLMLLSVVACSMEMQGNDTTKVKAINNGWSYTENSDNVILKKTLETRNTINSLSVSGHRSDINNFLSGYMGVKCEVGDETLVYQEASSEKPETQRNSKLIYTVSTIQKTNVVSTKSIVGDQWLNNEQRWYYEGWTWFTESACTRPVNNCAGILYLYLEREEWGSWNGQKAAEYNGMDKSVSDWQALWAHVRAKVVAKSTTINYSIEVNYGPIKY